MTEAAAVIVPPLTPEQEAALAVTPEQVPDAPVQKPAPRILPESVKTKLMRFTLETVFRELKAAEPGHRKRAKDLISKTLVRCKGSEDLVEGDEVLT